MSAIIETQQHLVAWKMSEGYQRAELIRLEKEGDL
jgi:hypothetical protein